LAHTLSALAVQLEGTRMLLEQRPGDPAAVASVDRAHRLASEGLVEARRAGGALRGEHLPGTDGMARLLEEFSQASGTPGHFASTGMAFELGSERQLAMFRTAQEALTNVRKHARATSVQMYLRYMADDAELVVEDAAPAANTNGASSQAHGLVGMRERAELLGRTLEAGPIDTGFKTEIVAAEAVSEIVRVLVVDDQTVVPEGLVML
jgi:signal transduction histidine kinase